MQTTLERTVDQFTSGIVNLPILFDSEGKPLFKFDEEKDRMKYEIVPDMRYPFFEYYNLDKFKVKRIMNHYKEFKIPFYMHRTMRGWHFLSTMSLHKDVYAEWIKPIMRLNSKCPMVTLRVKANKWIGEKDIWKQGLIVLNECDNYLEHNYYLQSLKNEIEKQQLGLIRNQYYLVHYRMTGELGNL